MNTSVNRATGGAKNATSPKLTAMMPRSTKAHQFSTRTTMAHLSTCQFQRRTAGAAGSSPTRALWRRSRSRNCDPLRLALLTLVQRDPEHAVLQSGLHAGFIDVGGEGEAPDEPHNA